MRHDVRMTQSSSAASRQRVGNSGSGSSSSRSSNEYDEHYRSYHHGYHYRSNGINGYSTNEHGNSGATSGNGGTVSALSGGTESHESQRQWEWLEDVLAKSQRNGETVRLLDIAFLIFFSCSNHFRISSRVESTSIRACTHSSRTSTYYIMHKH